MKKGDWVRVVTGPNIGRSGKVFWVGTSKFDSSMRVGFKDACGNPLWEAADALVIGTNSARSQEDETEYDPEVMDLCWECHDPSCPGCLD